MLYLNTITLLFCLNCVCSTCTNVVFKCVKITSSNMPCVALHVQMLYLNGSGTPPSGNGGGSTCTNVVFKWRYH